MKRFQVNRLHVTNCITAFTLMVIFFLLRSKPGFNPEWNFVKPIAMFNHGCPQFVPDYCLIFSASLSLMARPHRRCNHEVPGSDEKSVMSKV